MVRFYQVVDVSDSWLLAPTIEETNQIDWIRLDRGNEQGVVVQVLSVLHVVPHILRPTRLCVNTLVDHKHAVYGVSPRTPFLQLQKTKIPSNQIAERTCY